MAAAVAVAVAMAVAVAAVVVAAVAVAVAVAASEMQLKGFQALPSHLLKDQALVAQKSSLLATSCKAELQQRGKKQMLAPKAAGARAKGQELKKAGAGPRESEKWLLAVRRAVAQTELADERA